MTARHTDLFLHNDISSGEARNAKGEGASLICTQMENASIRCMPNVFKEKVSPLSVSIAGFGRAWKTCLTRDDNMTKGCDHAHNNSVRAPTPPLNILATATAPASQLGERAPQLICRSTSLSNQPEGPLNLTGVAKEGQLFGGC